MSNVGLPSKYEVLVKRFITIQEQCTHNRPTVLCVACKYHEKAELCQSQFKDNVTLTLSTDATNTH